MMNNEKTDRFFVYEQVHFAKEQISVLVLFLFWATIVLAMQLFVKWLDAQFEVADFYISTLILVEKAILIADIVWCLIMLLTNTSKLLIRAYYDVKEYADSLKRSESQ